MNYNLKEGEDLNFVREIQMKEADLLRFYIKKKWGEDFKNESTKAFSPSDLEPEQCYLAYLTGVMQLTKKNPRFTINIADENHFAVSFDDYRYIIIEYYKEFGIICYYYANMRKENEIMRFYYYEFQEAINALKGVYDCLCCVSKKFLDLFEKSTLNFKLANIYQSTIKSLIKSVRAKHLNIYCKCNLIESTIYITTNEFKLYRLHVIYTGLSKSVEKFTQLLKNPEHYVSEESFISCRLLTIDDSGVFINEEDFDVFDELFLGEELESILK